MSVQGITGLSQAEAARQLIIVGPNALPDARGRRFGVIVFETMREPMFVLLLCAALLYIFLGSLGEGLFMLVGAVATIGLVILQETRSERALAALRDLSQPHARVIRDATEQRLLTRDLVPEDVVLVGEGERLPADGILIAGDILSIDESALTGESAPVTKCLAVEADHFVAKTAPGDVGSPYLFAGTMVVRGQGVMQVKHTGATSALGKIGASLAAMTHEPTPLQQTAGRLVAVLGLMAIGFCALVVIAFGLLRDDWIAGVLAGITVAIALIPEEFPMVLAVFLALGAWRLATHRVLVRRSAVIETLGGATALCIDKTGTLTENNMRVARLWTRTTSITSDGDAAIPQGPMSELLDLAALASAARPVDPMDKAIRALHAQSLGEGLYAAQNLERSWPLRPELMAIIQVWRGQGEARIGAAKGAPEAIFSLCNLARESIADLTDIVREFAEDGLRVLAIASCETIAPFPNDPRDAPFQFAGLVAFIDPLRLDARLALQEARAAGIKVIMITGDHPATAEAIADAAGIETAAGTLLGAEIAEMPFTALQSRLQEVCVFARVAPEQKLLIVKALRANGETVAMTGDGVNDAPALEAAHIGIAMGKKGTDVAREAADLILLDDSFASIVGGIRLGRRIFANLRRALTYITAIHVPIAGLALLPILFGLPQLLFPMHVVLLELAIDPICALVFENERSDEGAMKRPPRRQDEALFGGRQLMIALMQGAVLLAAVFTLYVWALQRAPEAEARGVAFVALTLGNLVLALTDTMATDGKLFAPHRTIFWSLSAAIVSILALIFTVPPLTDIFRVALPDTTILSAGLLVAVLAGGAPAIISSLNHGVARARSTLSQKLAHGQ